MCKEKNVTEKLEFWKNQITEGLKNICPSSNWYEEYNVWRSDPLNQFDSLLTVKDPFNVKCAGDKSCFDLSNEDENLDIDLIAMSSFYSIKILELERKTVDAVVNARFAEERIQLISSYFNVIDDCVKSEELSPCILILNRFAEEQLVLHAERNIDLYIRFYTLRERLRKESAESIFLLFELWRIERKDYQLKNLISSIVNYIRSYFNDYDRDPDMHLYYPIDNLSLVEKMNVMSHWFEIIAFHTNGIFEKYKELNWLYPQDCVADDIEITNQISRYQMLKYKLVFISDDEKTVVQKAICNQGYGVWIKTADVVNIFFNILQILNSYDENKLSEFGISKAQMINLTDKTQKTFNDYTSKVFFHQVYYQDARSYMNYKVVEAKESEAELANKSIDDVIGIIHSFISDDIEELLSAKQSFKKTIENYTTEEQKSTLDILTEEVVKKIKKQIGDLEIYNELYNSLSNEFVLYKEKLQKHTKIFSTLVSAEYLYSQYVEGKSANKDFDYSCISVMYYMALEDFVNRLVYTPYCNEILSTIGKNDWKKYVTHYSAFWDNKSKSYKNSCEIGNLGFLFSEVKEREKFKDYMEEQFVEIDLNSITTYGDKLKRVAPRRNEAAHGGNILSYDDVQQDKGNVYSSDVEKYRGLIIELLSILYK